MTKYQFYKFVKEHKKEIAITIGIGVFSFGAGFATQATIKAVSILMANGMTNPVVIVSTITNIPLDKLLWGLI